MRSTGIICSMDDSGRIVVPKEVRKELDIESDSMFEVYSEWDEEGKKIVFELRYREGARKTAGLADKLEKPCATCGTQSPCDLSDCEAWWKWNELALRELEEYKKTGYTPEDILRLAMCGSDNSGTPVDVYNIVHKVELALLVYSRINTKNTSEELHYYAGMACGILRALRIDLCKHEVGKGVHLDEHE